MFLVAVLSTKCTVGGGRHMLLPTNRPLLLYYNIYTDIFVDNSVNKKHLQMLGPFATASSRTPPVLILHCHSPGVATVNTTTKMSQSQL